MLSENDKLSFARTSLALERTFLAFVRTGLSFVMAGFALIRYFTIFHDFYFHLGWCFVVTGLIFLGYGLYTFAHHKKYLNDEKKQLE